MGRLERVETGRMQFADDWPGVFIRGDDALGFARSLRLLADRVKSIEPEELSAWSRVTELAALLESCRVKR
jgi:hypothetical protein